VVDAVAAGLRRRPGDSGVSGSRSRTHEQGDKAEWTPFVTIRTSGYEQYIGGQAASFCDAKTMTWDAGDLTAALQRRVDSR